MSLKTHITKSKNMFWFSRVSALAGKRNLVWSVCPYIHKYKKTSGRQNVSPPPPRPRNTHTNSPLLDPFPPSLWITDVKEQVTEEDQSQTPIFRLLTQNACCSTTIEFLPLHMLIWKVGAIFSNCLCRRKSVTMTSPSSSTENTNPETFWLQNNHPILLSNSNTFSFIHILIAWIRLE